MGVFCVDKTCFLRPGHIYMNDLSSVVHGCQLNMHADDMELHCFNSDLFSTKHGLHSE